MKVSIGRFTTRSLRLRITITLVGLTAALGLVALSQATNDLTNILEMRVEKQGVALARDMAAESASLSPTNDIFSLFELVSGNLINNDDVQYIFLVEPSGEIRVHTFDYGVPPALLAANNLESGETESILRLNTSEGTVIDIANRVFGWQGGVVRVGMTLNNVHGLVVAHTIDLGLLVALATLASVAAALALSSLLTRPLVRLAEAAKAVGRGNMSLKVPVDAADELGDLAHAFNTMTDDLVHSRDDLMHRNTELKILNSMADHLSQRLAPEEIPGTSLQKLLEATGFPHGWICLKEENGEAVLTSYHSGSLSASKKVDNDAHSCPLDHIQVDSQGSIANNIPPCSLLQNDIPDERPASSAIVPVSSREGVLGILVVAAESRSSLDESLLPLLRSVGQQIGVALENARLDREVYQKEEARGHLLYKLINAQEEERKRIAREIHDDPTQSLSAIVLRLDQLKRHLPATLSAEREELEAVHKEARMAMESLHHIMVELRPQALDDLGFLPAIRWYAELRLAERSIRAEFSTSGTPERLDPQIETAVFRLMQEAINNIYKHSEATQASINLDFSPGSIAGVIKDNGKGFDTAPMHYLPIDSKWLGLMGMEERASILGGRFTLTSKPGAGTRIAFEIPLPKSKGGHEE